MEINRKRGPTPWSLSVLWAALTIYNYFSTPRTEDAKTKEEKSLKPKVSFGAVFASFFQKKNNWFVLAFILLFRLGESIVKMLPFLIDEKSVGGMG
jgi:PAT family beta-lactamase induction signal transducer AmpG